MLWECYHCCNGIVLNALWIDGQLQAYFPILLNSSHVTVTLNPYPTAGILEKNCKGSKRIAESEYNWHVKNPSCQMTWGSVNLDPRIPCPLFSTPSIDQTLHQFANLLPNWTLLPILTLLPNFGGFHRTLQRVWLANRGRLLLRKPGPVHFGTYICSNVEAILSWTCHVYGPFEFRSSLGTSILHITDTCMMLNKITLYILKSTNLYTTHLYCNTIVIIIIVFVIDIS